MKASANPDVELEIVRSFVGSKGESCLASGDPKKPATTRQPTALARRLVASGRAKIVGEPPKKSAERKGGE